ncbi:MAG: hypothetical protein ACTSUE_13070 [Promethearchaeota archaeon]
MVNQGLNSAGRKVVEVAPGLKGKIPSTYAEEDEEDISEYQRYQRDRHLSEKYPIWTENPCGMYDKTSLGQYVTQFHSCDFTLETTSGSQLKVTSEGGSCQYPIIEIEEEMKRKKRKSTVKYGKEMYLDDILVSNITGTNIAKATVVVTITFAAPSTLEPIEKTFKIVNNSIPITNEAPIKNDNAILSDDPDENFIPERKRMFFYCFCKEPVLKGLEQRESDEEEEEEEGEDDGKKKKGRRGKGKYDYLKFFQDHGGKKIHVHSFLGEWLFSYRYKLWGNHGNHVELYRVYKDKESVCIPEEDHRALLHSITTTMFEKIPYISKKSISIKIAPPIVLQSKEIKKGTISAYFNFIIIKRDLSKKIDAIEYVQTIGKKKAKKK